MNNDTVTDIIIHTSEQLDENQFASVSRAVYDDAGVISLSRNLHAPRCLIVVYNAAVTRSRDILDRVMAQGFSARLVGM